MRDLIARITVQIVSVPMEMETGELILATAYLLCAVLTLLSVEPLTVMGMAYTTTGVIHVAHHRKERRKDHGSTQDSTKV